MRISKENRQRMLRAEETLKHYEPGSDPSEEVLTDLLCDLMHWAGGGKNSQMFGIALFRATTHYRAETTRIIKASKPALGRRNKNKPRKTENC